VIEASARWLSAEQATRLVEARELDPQAVVEAHLDAIDRLDSRIHAYIHVDRGARSTSGVTLAVKDSQPVRGMPYTYATSSLRDQIASEDAVAVARARMAGMAVLGKTNLPELAASIGTNNELFGPTHNPWRHGVTPGGSSGGSGAAVAAGMASVALGDDMGGSIRIPASCCGVVGLRPTPHRVPTEERDPTGLSSRGPIARSVADARLIFSIASGTRPEAGQRRPRVVGVTWSGAGGPCADACRRAAAAIEGDGHRIEEIEWDAEPVTQGYAGVRRASVASFPADHSTFGAALRKLAAEGRELSAMDYFRDFTEATDAAHRTVSLPLQTRYDFLLTPTLGLMPMSIEDVPPFLGEEWSTYVRFLLPVSFARTPAISIPAGLHDGLPVGVQIVGRFAQEYELLDFAERLEQMPGFGFQRPPGLDSEVNG
jgi:Asp-tRNA(Asn)/Glu-tRNA(Gln) amidotransferase A subunit family amidase